MTGYAVLGHAIHGGRAYLDLHNLDLNGRFLETMVTVWLGKQDVALDASGDWLELSAEKIMHKTKHVVAQPHAVVGA